MGWRRLTMCLLWGALLCGEVAQAKECVVLVTASSGRQFWRVVESGARSAANEAGVELLFREPKDELAIVEQVAILGDTLRRKCRGLLLVPQTPSISSAVQPWRDAGIPIVQLDRDIDIGPVYAKIMSDNYATGVMAGQAMLSALPEHSRIAVLRMSAEVLSTTQREQGFIDVVSRGKMTLVPAPYLGTSMAEIRHAAGPYLEKNAGWVQGLFTPNERTTMGVQAELRRLHLKQMPLHIGVDYNHYLLNAMQEGRLQGMVVQQPWQMGYQGVKWILAAKQGGPAMKGVQILPTLLLTPETLSAAPVQQVLKTYGEFDHAPVF